MKNLTKTALLATALFTLPTFADEDAAKKEQEDIKRCEAAKKEMGEFPGMPKMSCEEIIKASKER